MHLDEFMQSLDASAAPQLSPPLRALWHLRRKEWDAAHRIVQDESDADSAWVHAHLHRVEGDLSNAQYWYTRAGRRESRTALDEEWRDIVRTLLDASQ